MITQQKLFDMIMKEKAKKEKGQFGKMQAYNGWSNYETWVTKLWIDNDYSTYTHFRNEARRYDHEIQGDQYKFGEHIKDDFEEANPLGDEASVFSDLMSSALSEVDWYEIAGSIMDEVKEEDDYNKEHRGGKK
jgi:hypothetical protein